MAPDLKWRIYTRYYTTRTGGCAAPLLCVGLRGRELEELDDLEDACVEGMEAFGVSTEDSDGEDGVEPDDKDGDEPDENDDNDHDDGPGYPPPPWWLKFNWDVYTKLGFSLL